jgi:hypothetical protein
MKKIFLSVFTLCVLTMHAQTTVTTNVKVNDSTYHKIELEGGGQSMAVLKDTVYTIWQGEPTDSTSYIYFAKSTDTGTTFTTEIKVYDGSNTDLHVFPSLFVAPNGEIYVAWTAITNNENDWNIWFAKSTNGGVSFQTPKHLTSNNASVYPVIGVFKSNVYVFYADAVNYPCVDYYLLRSTNGGASFNTPVQVNDSACKDGVEFSEVTSMALDTSGNIYLAWVDGRRSHGQGDIFFAKSTDNGQNISKNVMVNDVNQTGADSIQYIPSITADNSNNVYVSFTDKRNGDQFGDHRVYLARSSNGGTSFASESLLAGHNGASKSHDIVSNDNGKLSAVMCNNNNFKWGVWLAESSDKGVSFAAPIALSDSFDKDPANVSAVNNARNEIFAVWKDNRAGVEDVYFARTRISCPSTYSTLTESVCDSLVWIDGKTYYSSTNTATHTIMNSAGCDSIITLNLTVNSVDASVTANNATLTANQAGANYQWLDCDNNKSPIAGATNQSYTATANGNYAVAVDDGMCFDTSTCYAVTGLSIYHLSSANINIYPNPTNGTITVEGEHIMSIQIIDAHGQLIKQTESAVINLSGEAKGIYFIQVKTKDGFAIHKLVLD